MVHFPAVCSRRQGLTSVPNIMHRGGRARRTNDSRYESWKRGKPQGSLLAAKVSASLRETRRFSVLTELQSRVEICQLNKWITYLASRPLSSPVGSHRCLPHIHPPIFAAVRRERTCQRQTTYMHIHGYRSDCQNTYHRYMLSLLRIKSSPVAAMSADDGDEEIAEHIP